MYRHLMTPAEIITYHDKLKSLSFNFPSLNWKNRVYNRNLGILINPLQTEQVDLIGSTFRVFVPKIDWPAGVQINLEVHAPKMLDCSFEPNHPEWIGIKIVVLTDTYAHAAFLGAKTAFLGALNFVSKESIRISFWTVNYDK